MAIHASPGVYYEIKDYSDYVSEVTTTTLALVGKTVKGPTEPTFINSVRAFTDTYGLPRTDDYSALAAISYLEFGNALWFKRLVGDKARLATAEIPTSNEIDPVSVDRVDNQFVYSVQLDSEPIPETIEIKLSSATNSFNPVYIRDTKLYTAGGSLFGYFDPTENASVTDDVNYVRYSTGDFRVQLASELTTTSLVAKIIRNRTDLVCTNEADNITDVTVDSTNKKVTGTIKWTGQGYKSNIGKKSFVFDLDTVDKTDKGSVSTNADLPFKGEVGDFYKVTEKNKYYIWDAVSNSWVDNGETKPTINNISYTITVDSEGNFVCTNNITGANVILDTSSTLNLYTGEFVFKFNTTDTFAATTPSITVAFEMEQFKWQVIGTGKSFTNQFGTAVDDGSVFMYILDTSTLSTLDDWSEALSDEFKAVLYDDEGSLKETSFGANILQKGTSITNPDGSVDVLFNAINYSTKELNFVLAKALDSDTVITLTYNAKNEISYGSLPSSKYFTVTIPYRIINSSLSIFIEDTDRVQIGKVENDDIVGVGSEQCVGSVTLDSTGLNTIVECKYSGTKTGNVILTFNRSMGKISSRSYGSAQNGIQLNFVLEDLKNTDSTKYYGLKVWDSETLTTQTPQEYFREFTLGSDTDSVTHFVNSVTSSYVEFDLYDATLKPLLNNTITLTNGFDDADNITVSSAVKALKDFENTETYEINLIACPDYPGDKILASALIELCEVTRGDCFCIIDPPKGLSVQNVVNWHNGDGIYTSENALNSAYAALYYPWVKISNEFTETVEWVPPSVKMVAVYAYSDANGELWFAPAGLNRGKIFSAISVETQLTINDRDLMYATGTNCVNPICDFVGDGIVVYGQKTLQRKTSALNRINVVRLILYITKLLAISTRYLLFEPHDEVTWTRYVNMVTPYLDNIKSRRGMYYYDVKCDSTTNTASDIDNNTMIAEITLQPTKAVERIITRYKITGQSTSTEITE